MTDRVTSEPVSRRTLVSGAALTLPVLAACGGEETTSTDGPSTSPSTETSVAIASTSDIEVGGGAIIETTELRVVITQPSEGDFKAFNATCTHHGCMVNEVSEGTIKCPCHKSRFSIEDGAPQNGPASVPLFEVEITVEGDQIQFA